MEQLKGAKFDGGKPRPSTVPVEAILAILETRMYGFEKYGNAEDWRSSSCPKTPWDFSRAKAV